MGMLMTPGGTLYGCAARWSVPWSRDCPSFLKCYTSPGSTMNYMLISAFCPLAVINNVLQSLPSRSPLFWVPAPLHPRLRDWVGGADTELFPPSPQQEEFGRTGAAPLTRQQPHAPLFHKHRLCSANPSSNSALFIPSSLRLMLYFSSKSDQEH